MKAFTQERWARLWRNASGRGDGRPWLDVLNARYGEPHRHYHTAQHIEECLSEFDSTSHLATQPIAVELAIWFHDVVYDTHASDNEEQSALLADQCLTEAGTKAEVRLEVGELVLATKMHDSSNHTDAALLLDIDLSILGSQEDRFAEYETQIRREYAWVPDDVFVAKRAEILERFLSRGSIYSTEWFSKTRENRARENLRSSLEKLRSLK